MASFSNVGLVSGAGGKRRIIGISTITDGIPTNLFNSYTPGAGTATCNGSRGNNGNRRALARRAQINRGTMNAPHTGRCCFPSSLPLSPGIKRSAIEFKLF